MKKSPGMPITCLSLLVALALPVLLTGCGGSGGSSSYYYPGRYDYGVYHSYGYSHGYYDDDDIIVRMDTDKVEARQQQRQQTRPERQQNYQAARSQAASMGRPSGAGRGGGRGGGGRR